jgi:hypothetical protein
MSVAQLESLYSEAVAALESGDYDTAILKAMAIKARLGTTPNVLRSLGGGGQQQLQWANVAAMNSFIADCRSLKNQARAESLGIQQTKITYARPDDTSDL